LHASGAIVRDVIHHRLDGLVESARRLLFSVEVEGPAVVPA